MANKFLAIILATLAASPALSDGHAAAESDTGLYGFTFLGATSLQDPTFSGSIAGAPQDVETFFEDSSINFGIGIGRSLPTLGEGFRGELELSYSDSDIDNTNFSGNALPQEDANGGISTTRFLASIYRDFSNESAFTPYIGGGLGVAFTDLDISYGPGVTLNESDENLSAQIVLGGSYELTDQLALTTDLRFTRDFDVESSRLSPTGDLTGTVSDDIDNVSLNLGLRFAF